MKKLQLRYILAVLCSFLIFGAGCFSTVSCRSQKAPALDINGSEPETVIPELVLAEDNMEETSTQAYFVMALAEGSDIILEAYQDPDFRDRVIAFFGTLTGSPDVARVVLNNSVAFDISPALAFALCWEESRYNPQAFNRNRNESVDRGLFQLNSGTFPDLKTYDFYDLEINAQKGLSHLRWCLNMGGTDVAGLAIYNAGHNRVRSSGTPKTTLDYISRIFNEQRRIEGLFMTEYARLVYIEPVEEEIIKPATFRLSLLTPLGGY